MKTFILFFYLSILIVLPGLASGSDSKPDKDSAETTAKPAKKICTCELIKLVNNDSKIETIALLAEKTSNGKLKLDYKITAFELWKEKKYLSVVFVNDIKKIKKVQEAVNCEGLYNKLKLKYRNLKMHSIIDIDARSLVATR